VRPRRRGHVGRRAVAAAIGALVLGPLLATAHALLVKSVPARRAAVAAAPARVRLWFNEAVEARFSRLSVWDARGSQVDLRDVAADAEEPRQLTVGLPPLAPGRYVVRFRVLSVDGHVVEGEFPFTVRSPS